MPGPQTGRCFGPIPIDWASTDTDTDSEHNPLQSMNEESEWKKRPLRLLAFGPGA